VRACSPTHWVSEEDQASRRRSDLSLYAADTFADDAHECLRFAQVDFLLKSFARLKSRRTHRTAEVRLAIAVSFDVAASVVKTTNTLLRTESADSSAYSAFYLHTSYVILDIFSHYVTVAK